MSVDKSSNEDHLAQVSPVFHQDEEENCQPEEAADERNQGREYHHQHRRMSFSGKQLAATIP
jgi:hypothetical protein